MALSLERQLITIHKLLVLGPLQGLINNSLAEKKGWSVFLALARNKYKYTKNLFTLSDILFVFDRLIFLLKQIY